MSIVDQIREKLPIAAFVAPHTGGLTPSGNGYYIGRCPFHQEPGDRRKKFWVSPERGLCSCLVPRCQGDRKPMDVINFWARLQGISNSQAIDEMASKIGLVKLK